MASPNSFVLDAFVGQQGFGEASYEHSGWVHLVWEGGVHRIEGFYLILTESDIGGNSVMHDLKSPRNGVTAALNLMLA